MHGRPDRSYCVSAITHDQSCHAGSPACSRVTRSPNIAASAGCSGTARCSNQNQGGQQQDAACYCDCHACLQAVDGLASWRPAPLVKAALHIKIPGRVMSQYLSVTSVSVQLLSRLQRIYRRANCVHGVEVHSCNIEDISVWLTLSIPTRTPDSDLSDPTLDALYIWPAGQHMLHVSTPIQDTDCRCQSDVYWYLLPLTVVLFQQCLYAHRYVG